SASEDGNVHLWELATGRQTASLTRRKSWARVLAFAPDGQTLAAGHMDGLLVRCKLSERRKELVNRGQESIWSLAFAPDGQTLITGTGDGQLTFWSMLSGLQLRRVEAHRNLILSLTFAPDGKTIASAGSDRQVKLWDAARYANQFTLE